MTRQPGAHHLRAGTSGWGCGEGDAAAAPSSQTSLMRIAQGWALKGGLAVLTGGVHAECGDGTGDYVVAGYADVSQRTGLRVGVLLPHLHHLLLKDSLVHRHRHAGRLSGLGFTRPFSSQGFHLVPLGRWRMEILGAGCKSCWWDWCRTCCKISIMIWRLNAEHNSGCRGKFAGRVVVL